MGAMWPELSYKPAPGLFRMRASNPRETGGQRKIAISNRGKHARRPLRLLVFSVRIPAIREPRYRETEQPECASTLAFARVLVHFQLDG
jgi:hypothetical protein